METDNFDKPGNPLAEWKRGDVNKVIEKAKRSREELESKLKTTRVKEETRARMEIGAISRYLDQLKKAKTPDARILAKKMIISSEIEHPEYQDMNLDEIRADLNKRYGELMVKYPDDK